MPRVLFAESTPEASATDGGKAPGDYEDSSKSIRIGQRLKIKNLLAAYTVTAKDTGSLLVAKAALTITLPAASESLKGVYVDIFNKTDTDLTIASTADQMVTFNDVDADAIAFSTSSEKVGAAVRAVCDGTHWLVMIWAQETQTPTVTT